MGRQGTQWEEGRRGSRSTAGGMARARGSAAKSLGRGWGRPDGNPLASERPPALSGETGRGPPGPSAAKACLTQWKFSCLSVFLMPELISEVDHVIPSSERVSSSLRGAAYSGKESIDPQRPLQA